MLLEFTVLGEPKGKARHRTTKSGFTYTPKEQIQYENLVKISFQEAYPNWVPTDKEIVHVDISAYFLTPKAFSKSKRELIQMDLLHPMKKPDVDNIAKSILDSLNNIVYLDDKQVTCCVVSKYYDDKPRVDVSIMIKEDI